MPQGENGKEVLGSLPHRRPGIESPRRARARASSEQPSPGTAGSEAPSREPGDLEQLARTGIRVAGGAAGLGLKLAGRAVGELGRVVGRR